MLRRWNYNPTEEELQEMLSDLSPRKDGIIEFAQFENVLNSYLAPTEQNVNTCSVN